MGVSLAEYLTEGRALLQAAAEGDLGDRVEAAVAILVGALAERRPVLVCGNGGSAADALHIAGELVGRFLLDRPAYPVIALNANPSVLTAWANDVSYETVFSRQVEAHGREGGVVWGISTSGNSANVIAALETARKLGMATIGLTGAGGGRMATLCDALLAVPSSATPRIQEVHLCLYHFICAEVERRLVTGA